MQPHAPTIIAASVVGEGILTWAIPLGVFLAVLLWYLLRRPAHSQP